MTEFVEWRPTHDGHKPPFWVGTMGAETTVGERRRYHTPIPHWTDGVIYHVPREAVYGPAIDWTKPICTAPTDWQPSIDAELVSGPHKDGPHKVKILGDHFTLKSEKFRYSEAESWFFTKEGFFGGTGNNPDYIRIINRPACEDAGSIDPVLYERMVKLVKQIPMTLLPADIQIELYAIAAELEPVDPLLQLAREVCEKEGGAVTKFTSGVFDHWYVMRCALAMGKAMQERKP